jgi:predicted AlkP superfamily pyrophosphatase or phosphodiesterase
MMNRRLILLLGALFSVFLLNAQKTAGKKVVFVIADGIPADIIERLQPPAIFEIAGNAGFKRAIMGGRVGEYSETPTISAVGYNCLLTGTWSNKHNVVDNRIEEPNYNYYTIFRLFKEAYPKKKIAVYSTWEDNRTKLIGEGLPATGRIKMDYYFDGLEKDTVLYPHDNESNYIKRIDEAVAKAAAETMAKHGPDLNWVYLQYTDDIGHKYGDSKKMDSAVLYADMLIGKIYEAVRYRISNFHEDWMVIITTDHGRDAVTGKGHGGQSERERSIWIATNANDLNEYFHRAIPTMVDIMPTMARHLDIDIPADKQFELDGVPLIGKVSLFNPRAQFTSKGELLVTWESLGTDGNVKISVSETDNFKTGGRDEYILLGETSLNFCSFKVPFKGVEGKKYKIVLEGKDNTVNVQTEYTNNNQE